MASFWGKRRKGKKKISVPTEEEDTTKKIKFRNNLRGFPLRYHSTYLPIPNQEVLYERIPFEEEGIGHTEVKQLPEIPYTDIHQRRLTKSNSTANFSPLFGTATELLEQPIPGPQKLPMYNAHSCEKATHPSSVHVMQSVLFGEGEEGLEGKNSLELLTCLEESKGNKRQDVIQYIKNRHIPRLIKNRKYKELFQLLLCRSSSVMLLVLRELRHMIIKDFIELPGCLGDESFSIDEFDILLHTIKRCMVDMSVLPDLIHTTCMASCNLILRDHHIKYVLDLQKVHAKSRLYLESNNLLGNEATELIKGLNSLIVGMMGDKGENNGLAIADWKSFLKNSPALRDRISALHKLPLKDKLCVVFMVSSNVLNGSQFSSRIELYATMLKECYKTEDKFLVTVTNFLSRDILRNVDSGKDLGDVLDHVIQSRPELMLYHRCPVIRDKCIANLKDTFDATCCHIEELLHRIDVTIERKRESTTTSKCISCLCEVNGKCAEIKILQPSIEDARDSPTKRYLLPPDVGFIHDKNINELDILRTLHEVDCRNCVVQLYAHQWTPKPFFYITERGTGENLSSLLLAKRESEEMVPIPQLLSVICQACKAVDFLHGEGIVHRDVTASAFECFLECSKDDIRVKLKTFCHAKTLWKPGDPPKRFLHGDVNVPEELPILWTAPESFRENSFSRYSDTWMAMLTANEIFTHGRWPMIKKFHNDENFKELMKGVIDNDTRPSQPPGMPTRIHALLLSGLSRNPEDRKGLPDIIARLQQEISLLGEPYPSRSGSYGNSEEYRSPEKMIQPLTMYQRGHHSKPLRGDVIKIYHQMEEDHEETYCNYTVREDDINSYFKVRFDVREAGSVAVMELVPDKFQMDDLKNISEADARQLQITPWPPDIGEWESRKASVLYNIPCGQTLQEVCRKRAYGDKMIDYVPILLELAKVIQFYHSRQLSLNCLRSKHIWIHDAYQYEVNQKFEISIPRIAFLKRIPEKGIFSNDLVLGKIDNAMKYWSAPEMLEEDAMISLEGDCFSFGRLLEEMSLLLQESSRGANIDLSTTCIPLVNVPMEELPRVLQAGKHMERQSNCPEWLYKEIILPCIKKERIERPSFQKIVEVLRRGWADENIYECISHL